jgi:hypothetical protein
VAGGNLEILRRSAGAASQLVSPWSDWTVIVMDGEYRVTGPDGRGFSAERTGEFVYLAWEKPKALVPHGRLWISDAGGLRSYVPDPARIVPIPPSK